MSVCTWHDLPKGPNFWNGFGCLWMPDLWHACSEMQWQSLASVLVNFMQTCEPPALLRDRPSSLQLGLHSWQYPKGRSEHSWKGDCKCAISLCPGMWEQCCRNPWMHRFCPGSRASVTECWSSAHTKGIWTSKDYLLFRENLFLLLFL